MTLQVKNKLPNNIPNFCKELKGKIVKFIFYECFVKSGLLLKNQPHQVRWWGECLGVVNHHQGFFFAFDGRRQSVKAN